MNSLLGDDYSGKVIVVQENSALSFYQDKSADGTIDDNVKNKTYDNKSKIANYAFLVPKDNSDVTITVYKVTEDGKQGDKVATFVMDFSAIQYGDISKKPGFQSYMGLIGGEKTHYTRNSKGKMVPIKEVGWADAGETPTHMVLQFDSSYGGAYVGSVGTTLWVDNVHVVY